ncbi:DedA family protein [Reinekea thalattae]|uniref:DedA family protein n=1 Tax=Reinekea thalattae TaxID=2593301 RepID=A0A5C8Z826_9GAMM|nr:DedA family protein [Reinekea thalattae]TXR54255.1 DedA family protein [Reinekea thalattae]
MLESPLFILLIIAGVCFFECLALFGLLIPGVVVLFSLAALANLYGLHPLPMLAVAVIFGFLGDLVSFYLGQRYLSSAFNSRRLARYKQWTEHGHWFIERWGWISIPAGRFLGPLRPIVPFLAGGLKMQSRAFVILSFFSCLIWAPAYLLPGYFTGELSSVWTVQPLSIRSLISYVLSALAICAFSLTIYHHMHPEKMHLRGWISQHQAERWPITSFVVLLIAVAILITVRQCYPLNVDQLFIIWRQDWQSFTTLSHLLSALNLLSNHLLVSVEFAMLILWLCMIGRYSIASIASIGFVLLYVCISQISHWVEHTQPVQLWNMASFIFTYGLLANITNTTMPAIKRWQVYLFIFILSLAITMSHLWLGHLSPSASLIAIALTAAIIACARGIWKLFNRQPKAAISRAFLLWLALLNTLLFTVALSR